MARVFTAKKSKRGKRIKCRKCGRRIKPGDKYYYYTRRFSRSKRVRGTRYTHCIDDKPRPTDLSSSPMAAVQEAQDDAFKAFEQATDGQEMQDAIEALKTAVQEVHDQAEESLENMPEPLRETSSSGEILTERANGLNDYLSELDYISVSEIEAADDGSDDDLETAREDCRAAIESLSI